LTLCYAAVKLKPACFRHLNQITTVTAHLQSADAVLSFVRERAAAAEIKVQATDGAEQQL